LTERGESSTYLMLAATMALWGSAFAGSKIALEYVPHGVAAMLRFGLGALLMLGWLALVGGLRLSTRELGRLAVAGLLGVFGYNALFFWGLSLAPSIDGSLLIPVLSPVLTVGAATVLLRERASRPRVAGLLLGLAGAAVFLAGIEGGFGEVGAERLLGDLIYVAAAATWAAYTLIGRRVLADTDPVRETTFAMVIGAVLLAGLAAPAAPDVAWSELPPRFWGTMAYLAIGPTALAFVLFYIGVRRIGPTRTSIMMFLVPVFGSVTAIVLLDESLSPVQVGGAVLMLAGALLALTEGRLGRFARTGDG
jgi:drug/metabolite transporter (DMT)-like permease